MAWARTESGLVRLTMVKDLRTKENSVVKKTTFYK